MSVTGYEDYLGTFQGTPPPISLTCNYIVVANGRVTLSGSNCGQNPPVIYLAAPNTGYLVDTAEGVDTGVLTPQSARPFNNASVSGTFTAGIPEVVSQNIGLLSVGLITLDGAGHVGGVADYTSTSTQASDQTITDTYSVNTNGTFTVGSSGANIVGIVINGNQFVQIEQVTQPYPIQVVGAK